VSEYVYCVLYSNVYDSDIRMKMVSDTLCTWEARICIHICTYVNKYIYIYTYVYICICTCIYGYVFLNTHIYTYTTDLGV